jgi:hypothetical protein
MNLKAFVQTVGKSIELVPMITVKTGAAVIAKQKINLIF